MSDRVLALESEVRRLRRELRDLSRDFDWVCRHLRVVLPQDETVSGSPRDLSVHLSGGDSEESYSGGEQSCRWVSCPSARHRFGS